MSKKRERESKKAPPKEDTDSDDDDFGMMSSFAKASAQPVQRQRVNAGGGGGNHARAVGIVLDIKNVMFDKRGGGKIPKRLLTLVAPTVTGNDATDFVGTKNGAWLLPVQEKVDEGSEDGAGDGGGGAGGGPVKKIYDLYYDDGPETRCRQIDGSLTVSLYTESLNADKGSDVGRMKVGDIVEVWGLKAVGGMNKAGTEATLYTNAGGGKIVTEGPGVARVNEAIMEYARDRQEYGLFNASMAKNGFFDARDLNEAQKHQAEVLQKDWIDHRDAASARFRALAVGKDQNTASKLVEQADRLAGHDPAFFATGNDIVPTEKKFDAPVVPLLLLGAPPCTTAKWENKVPAVLLKLNEARKDPAVLAQMPSQMLASVVHSLEFGSKEGSTGFTAYYQTVAIPDVRAAVEALKADKKADPGLNFGPMLAAEQSLKFYQSMSCRDPELVKMWCEELLLGPAVGSVFVKMLPVAVSGGPRILSSDWPVGSGMKLVLNKSLEMGAVLVSKEFIQKNTCEGTTQFVGERRLNPETAMAIYGEEEPVNFEQHGVQELTSGAWKFSHFDPDRFSDPPAFATMKVEYRVVYKGVRALLNTDDEARTDTEAGEAAITKAAADAGVDVSKFMCYNTLSYAVAVVDTE